MSVAERLVLVRQALAGVPLQGVADAERLQAGRVALRALAHEVNKELEEDPTAPVPFTPAQLEAWARDLHRPEVLAEALSQLRPPPQPVPKEPPRAEGVSEEAPSALVSFTRDVARGVLVGLSVGWLLGYLRR